MNSRNHPLRHSLLRQKVRLYFYTFLYYSEGMI